MFGVILGVIFINNIDAIKIRIVADYFSNFICSFVDIGSEELKLFVFNSLFHKSKFIFILFVLACTVIFRNLIYFCILYKGFVLGYAISGFLRVYGKRKGILFAITTLGIQNFIYIPCIIFFGGYCIKFCKKMKNNSVDIKSNFLKLFFVFCVVLVISIFFSTIEMFFSYKIVKKIQNFF